MTMLAAFVRPSAAADLECRRISFAGDVRAGEAFSRPIGGGLVLRFAPAQFSDPAIDAPLDGWEIALLPQVAENPNVLGDRIYPVNPPLRFNPWQQIGTSYAISVEEKLQQPIRYAFPVSEADYRAIRELAEGALWPYAAADLEQADERYLNALAAMTLGAIRFEAKRRETTADGKNIRHLAFTIDVTAPAAFAFAPGDQPNPAECPARDHWP